MVAAYDSVGPSSSGVTGFTITTGSWTHTPSGSLSHVVVILAAGVATSDATCTTTVTYGGVAMTSKSKIHTGGGTAGYVEMFSLDVAGGLLGGAQTVAVTRAGGTGTVTVTGASIGVTGGGTISVGGTGSATSATASTGAVTVPTGGIAVNGFASGQNFISVSGGSTSRFTDNNNSNTGAGNSTGTTATASGTFTATVSTSDFVGAISLVITDGSVSTNLDPNQAAHWKALPPGFRAPSKLSRLILDRRDRYVAPPSGPPFITTIDSTKHYFLDQYQNPILPLVDHEWNLMGWGGGRSELGGGTTPLGVFQGYASTQATNGFNGVLVLAVDSDQGGATGPFTNGNTHDGIAPFTGSIGALNPTYWSRMDDLINSMAAQGITVFLNLVASYNIQGGTAFAGLTPTNATTYGTAIGARYKSFPNIVYHFGSDYFASFETELTNIVTALRAAGDNHVVLCEYMAESETRKDSAGTTTGTFGTGTSVDVDDVYTYNASYLETEKSYQQSSPTRPTFYFNGRYDQTTSGYDTVLLDDELWGLTSGSHGLFYGAESTWAWGTTAYGHLTTDTLRISWLKGLKTFWAGLSGWQNLVPDISSTFITSARGTKVTALASGGGATAYTGGNTYLTGGVTADGKLAVLYTPTSRTITLDGSKLVASYTATWVDPYSFATLSATPNLTSYTTPGSNSQSNTRWILVLAEAGSLVTGTATISETVTITAAGVVGAATGASITETTAITSTGTVAMSTGASVSETVTITAAGAVGKSSGSSIALSATIISDGGGNAVAGASIGLTDTITSTGVVAKSTGVTLTETVSIVSTGVVAESGAATVPLTDTITTTGVVGKVSGATVGQTVTINATGTVTAVGTGSAAITETATIATVGVVGKSTGAALAETVTINATAVVSEASDAALVETVTITAAGSVTGGVGATMTETVTIAATGTVARSTGSSLSLHVAVQAAGVAIGGGATLPAAHPRAVIVNNPHQAMMVANTHGGYVVDNIRQGDSSPPFTCVILDGTAPYDATGATSVVVKVWQDGVLLFSRAASTVTAGGVVTAAWQAGETDEPGPIKAVVQVTTAGKLSTFPPRGYLEAHISPLSPV